MGYSKKGARPQSGNPIIITAAETWVCKDNSLTFENVIFNPSADATLVLAVDSSSADDSNIVVVRASANASYDVFNGVEKTYSRLYVRTLSAGRVQFHLK